MPSRPYNPADIEAKIYRRWERAKAFMPATAKPRGKKQFSVVTPPPNITGSLHMGHALNNTMQDALVRYHRMKGDDTVWVPGTDHAGIATQNVVERMIKEKEGKTRQDLGRKEFLKRVWAWKEQHGGVITEQLRMLGASCDWSRERFTLDAGYSRAVQEAFLHYARKGLIYRGERLVNWCPRCASSISDLEVKYEERPGKFYRVNYPLVDGSGSIKIYTTRPETILGDTAIAVNPHDKRYRAFVGKQVRVPLTDREVPIIEDAGVNMEVGSGALKVTPAHDPLDWDIGERNSFKIINVIGESGRMTTMAGERYQNFPVEEAREKVINDLKDQGSLTESTIDMKHQVPLCDRCGTVIQPLVSLQWFIKMEPLAKPARAVLEQQLITVHPARWGVSLRDWLRTVKDWCISRQLWWGHPLPVWFCDAYPPSHPDAHYEFSIVKPRRCSRCESTKFMQSSDVLDTWFSSALWPFAVFGWPEATEDLRRFYPTSVLATDRGILNLWVARMIFSGLECMNPTTFLPARVFGSRSPARQIPFRDVMIHPTVLNLKGQRMSKSLGTGVDPLDLIREFGADATRFGLLIQSQEDQQALRFDPNAVRTGRNFVNKLWNLARFVERAGVQAGKRGRGLARSHASTLPRSSFDQWILSRLAETHEAVTDALETFRFGDALRMLHDFVWDDFADWYVEVSKIPGVTSPRVLQDVFRDALRLLHPCTPFVTEELWKTHGDGGLLLVASWPTARRRRKNTRISRATSAQMVRFRDIIQKLRSLRVLLGLPSSHVLRIHIRGSGILVEFFPIVESLTQSQIRGGDGNWAQLVKSGSTHVDVLRDDLAGIDVNARRTAAEQRHTALRQHVTMLEGRLQTMKDRAPEVAVKETASSLAARREELMASEEAVQALKAL